MKSLSLHKQGMKKVLALLGVLSFLATLLVSSFSPAAFADDVEGQDGDAAVERAIPPTITGVWGFLSEWSYTGGATSYINLDTQRIAFCAFSHASGPAWPSSNKAGPMPDLYTLSKTLTPSDYSIPGTQIQFKDIPNYRAAAYVINQYSQNKSKADSVNASLWNFTKTSSDQEMRKAYFKAPKNPAQTTALTKEARDYRGPYSINMSPLTYSPTKTVNGSVYDNVITSQVSFKSGAGIDLADGLGITLTVTLQNATFVDGGGTTKTLSLNGKSRTFNYLADAPGRNVNVTYTLDGLPSDKVAYYKPGGGLDRQPLLTNNPDKESMTKNGSITIPGTPTVTTQATNEDLSTGDVVTIIDGKAGSTVKLDSTLYYAGTSAPTESKSVPQGAKVVKAFTQNVTLDSSTGKAVVNVGPVDLDGKANGYYTWVTEVVGNAGENTNFTSSYGIPEETIFHDSYFPSASTGTSIGKQNPNGSYDVVETVLVTAAKPSSQVNVSGQLYFHGTTPPTQSQTIPSTAEKVGAAVTGSATADAAGNATVTLNKNIPGSEATGAGYYTWVTKASGANLKTFTSSYGVASETFYFPGKSDVTLATSTTDPFAESGKMVVKDTIEVSGTPGLTGLTAKSELYYHGTTKPTQDASVPTGKTPIAAATNSQTFALDATTGKAKLTTPAFDLKGQQTGYYTWVTTISGDGIKTLKSPYGVPSETFEYTKPAPSVVTQASKGTLDINNATFKDTIVISKGIPGSQATVKATPYFSTTKPTDSATVPGTATPLTSFSETVTLSSSGSATIEASVSAPRTSMTKAGWITWVVTVTGGGYESAYTSHYGVESETVEWGGAVGDIYTKTSEATYLNGNVTATDQMTITNELPGKDATVTFKLYYNGTSKPAQVPAEPLPSGATQIGGTQTKTVTIGGDGSAVVNSDPITVNSPGYYTWVATYDMSWDVELLEGVKGITGDGVNGYGVWTDDNYFIGNGTSLTKATGITGTILGATGEDPPHGSAVWSTEGYYLVAPNGVATKVDGVTGTVLGADGELPLSSGKGSVVWTTNGAWLVNENRVVTPITGYQGEIKAIFGGQPLSNTGGAGIATTQGFWVARPNGTTVNAAITANLIGGMGTLPLSSSNGSVVWSNNQLWAVSISGSTASKKTVTNVDTIKGVTGSYAPWIAGFAFWDTANQVYLVEGTTKTLVSGITGAVLDITGVFPAYIEKGGFGVLTTNGYWVVRAGVPSATKITAVPSGITTGFVDGNLPNIDPGWGMAFGSVVLTDKGAWYVANNVGSAVTGTPITGTPLDVSGIIPRSEGSVAVTTNGLWSITAAGVAQKLSFIEHKTVSNSKFDYGVPSETFHWNGLKGPTINTEANSPDMKLSAGTVDFTDEILLSGGVPGIDVSVKADLYYAGTSKPTESANVPSGKTPVASKTKTGTLDDNGNWVFQTDKITLNTSTAEAGYYTWVVTVSSPSSKFTAVKSKYGTSSETVHYEGVKEPALTTSSSALIWSGTSASLKDSVTLSGGTQGAKYDVTAKLYHTDTKPTQSETVPTGVTLIGTTPVVKATIGADGTATVETGAINLPNTPQGGAQGGYYTWVVTAKSTDVTSQTVTSDFGIPAETVHWEGLKTPTVTTEASLTADKKSALDSIILSGGTPGTKVTVKAQLYYAGTTAPEQVAVAPSEATAVGTEKSTEVTLDTNGAGTYVVPNVALPQDAGLGQSKVGFYTWVVKTSGAGLPTTTSHYGIPSETVEVQAPEKQEVIISTQIESNSSAAAEYGEEGALLLKSGDKVRDEIWAVGDILTKHPATVTATLYGPITGDQIPTTIDTANTNKFYETTVNVNKPGKFLTGYSPAITEPGLYAWVYSFPAKTATDADGKKHTLYDGKTDKTFYSEESARLMYNFKVDTVASPKGPSIYGVEASDQVTVSGYPPNTDVTITSYLWGPYIDKPVLADEPAVDPDTGQAPQIGSVTTTVKTDSNGKATFTVNKFPQGSDTDQPTNETITLNEGGWYVWTDSSDGIPGVTNPWQSKFGVESEMQYVNNAYTQVSEDFVHDGDQINDTFYIHGPLFNPSVDFQLFRKGNSGPVSDTLVYDEVESEDYFIPCTADLNVPAPKGCKQVDSPLITVGDNSVLEPGKEWEVGTYYWQGEFFNDGELVFKDPARLSEETFFYFTGESDAEKYVPAGGSIQDKLVLEGGLPIHLDVTFDLYKRGSGSVDTDTQIYDTVLGSWETNPDTGDQRWVPKTFPVWPEYFNGDEPVGVVDLPGSVTKTIESPVVSGLASGEYYWVSKVVVTGEAGASPVYTDMPRMENETSFIGPEVTTKTKGLVSVGSNVFDTATLSGPTPDGSTLVFELWKHGSGNSSTDTKVYTSTPVPAKNQGEYNSPTVKINESGIYYWIEKLIAPDGTTELAVGSPRLDNETVYVPEIGTSLVDSNGSKEVMPSASTTLVDTVTYENLRPGIAYDITGQLYHPDGSEVKVNGQNVTSTKTFTPTQSSGTVTVSFTFSTADLSGTDLVAFEKLFVKGETTPVATHEDPEDPGQTVKILGIDFQVEKLGMGVRVAGSEWELRGPTGTDNVQTGVVMPGQSPAGSVFKFDKVVPGEYDLVETKAPEGYELLAKPIRVTVSARGEVTVAAPAVMGTPIDGNPTIAVGDVPAKQLPDTGGFGWAWGIVAAVVIAGGLGGARLIIKRKKA